jgi:hypothetical protein
MSENQGKPAAKNQTKKAKKPATRMTKKVDFELTEEELAKASGGILPRCIKSCPTSAA